MQRFFVILVLCFVTLVLIPGDVPELSDAEFPIKPEDIETLFDHLLSRSNSSYIHYEAPATSNSYQANTQISASTPEHHARASYQQ